MTLTARLFGSGLRDVGRRRWLIVYLLFYVVLTDTLFRFGGSGPRAVLSLTNVVLGLVPLVGLLFGTIYVYQSREFIEMMLAQPVHRRSLFVGLYGGVAVPLAGSFVLGVGAPFLWNGGFVDGGRAIVLLLISGATLSVIFSGLGFLIALRFDDRASGLGVAIMSWLAATVLYDGLILLAVTVLQDYPIEQPLIGAMLVNPVDLARVLLLLQLDMGALAGYTGAVFERFFGTAQGSVWSGTALLAWAIVPFIVGMRRFAARDF
jgi:Cu-processing system permease protein